MARARAGRCVQGKESAWWEGWGRCTCSRELPQPSPGQGCCPHSAAGNTRAFQTPGELREETGCLGGEPPSQSTQHPDFVQQEPTSWRLGRIREARRPGLLPNSKFAPGTAYGRPGSATLRERQPPLHSLPTRFLSAPYYAFQQVSTAWLCGHQGHTSPCPQGVTTCRERHKNER